MANRRCLYALTRQASALFSTNPSARSFIAHLTAKQPLKILSTRFPAICTNPEPAWCTHCSRFRHFSSNRGNDDEDDDDEDEDVDYEETGENSEDESVSASGSRPESEYSAEEKEVEAAAIGYKVIGPLQKSDRVFKPYEPLFAVVQIGSHQFKVSNRDCIFTERLKFCEVNDKVILNKVLLLGSSSQTIVGRPIVPDAAVHAVVEEHALDAKVLIFKKKRRKNYRRTKGHRQELTKLRITDIQGIEKPENIGTQKPLKAAVKKPEKIAVAA
ncbi:large ribosomal subunit protein bL21m [Ziziphus jujuba]|uniref:Large ribosomal subunit protein bL21m n=1 Tax=Ziziphus jujuba TaxID=326968 RepID=A0ABM3I8V7_ZIZJJ|nr:large ribosomal subunit protein bL21m [Ziziphus jujuba]